MTQEKDRSIDLKIIEKQIKEEEKQFNETRKEIERILRKPEISFDWIADLSSSIDNLNNSIVWILSKQEVLKHDRQN